MIDLAAGGARPEVVPAVSPSVSFFRNDGASVAWREERHAVAYPAAVAVMEARAEAIRRGEASELAWLLEHPPTYTAGTSASQLLPILPFPVYRSGRGGQVTYHGPGQRVVYIMLDLEKRSPDIRAFVAALEEWLIRALATFGVIGERREDRVGVWVRRPEKKPAPDGAPAEDKIAAIGIRIRRWVSFHGVALNVHPDLTHYRAITPCGISDAHLGVTSLNDLGRACSLADVDETLRNAFEHVFGRTVDG